MAHTIKDIAKQTGLSLATISKFINGGNVKEKNRILIERAIKDLDYTVNDLARGLKSQRSKTIGVVIPELSNLFVTSILTVVEEHLRSQGYSVIICDCHTNEQLETQAIRFLMSKMVDGIINMPVDMNGKHLRPALEKKIPVVLIDRAIPGLTGKVDMVLVDNGNAARTATTQLLKCNHRDIGIIIGPANITTSEQRLTGYLQAMESFQCTAPEEYIAYSDYTVEGGYNSMRRLLECKRPVTAVFITNYEMTLGAIIAINELGVKIPTDLSVIGFDNMHLAQVVNPRLTIVAQPLNEIGRQVASVLSSRLLDKEAGTPLSITLSTSLQAGASVRKL